MNARGVRIEYEPLHEIKGDELNPKEHDLGAIIESIKRHGYVAPLIANETTGTLVAGHGRALALAAMRRAGDAAPLGIVERGDEWLVPVVRGVAFPSDDEARAYLVADNRTTSLGGWNEGALADLLSTLSRQTAAGLTGTGYDGDDLDAMLHRLARDGGAPADEDEAPEPPAAPVTQPGDLYRLTDINGIEHRLICGDCTETDLIMRLCGGTPDALITDPPYGLAVVDGAGRVGFGKAHAPAGQYRPVAGDADPFDPTHLLRRAPVVALMGANCYASRLPSSAGWLVWDKATSSATGKSISVAGRFSEAELIWTSRPRAAVDICRCLSIGFMREGEREPREHPTQKPVRLFAWLLRKLTEAGQTVLDPYAGSGTMLLACMQEKRAARLVEIDAGYCDVIVARWIKAGGRDPVREAAS